MIIRSIPNRPLERTQQPQTNGKAVQTVRQVPLRPSSKRAPRKSWDVWLVLTTFELVRYQASWVVYLAGFVKVKYPLLRRLVGTHLLGFVSSGTLDLRKRTCNECLFKYRGKDGGEYCKEDGCGCGCWKGSRITYKRRLSGFKCPRNKFGHGWLGKLWYRKGG
jgi:hypothetical protein